MEGERTDSLDISIMRNNLFFVFVHESADGWISVSTVWLVGNIYDAMYKASILLVVWRTQELVTSVIYFCSADFESEISKSDTFFIETHLQIFM